MKKAFYAFIAVIVVIVIIEVVYEQGKRNSSKVPLVSPISTKTDNNQVSNSIKTVTSVSREMLDQSNLEVKTRILDQKVKDYLITQEAKVLKIMKPLSEYFVRLSSMETVSILITSTTILAKGSSYEIDGNNYIVGMTFAPAVSSDLNRIAEGSKIRISYFEKQYSPIKPVTLVKLIVY